VSLGSVVASALLGPLAYLTGASDIIVIGALIVAAIVIERHRSNLGRLMAGSERRIGQRA
jgi:glycerol-3-phosphate acyltransferase PlsY